MSNRLANKVALITGGNSGIGRATARRFVEEGAMVIITGRNQQTLDETVAELGEASVLAIRADSARLEDIRRTMEIVKETYGRLDVLFLNAGIAPLTPLGQTTEEQVDELLSINIKGVFLAMQAAVPLFGANGGSVIVNSSVSSAKGFAGFGVYAATKAAVRSFARSFSAELAPKKIRVNSVNPGPVETPIFGKMGLNKEQAAGLSDQVTKHSPLGRFGRPGEIADAVVFLASDESSFMCGAELAVDGGLGQV